MSTPETRLAELGLVLPAPTPAVANYVPFVMTGNQLYVSGQVSLSDGELIRGRVGESMGLDGG